MFIIFIIHIIYFIFLIIFVYKEFYFIDNNNSYNYNFQSFVNSINFGNRDKLPNFIYFRDNTNILYELNTKTLHIENSYDINKQNQ